MRIIEESRTRGILMTNGRRYSGSVLLRAWLCNECGSRLVRLPGPGSDTDNYDYDTAVVIRCPNRCEPDFIHEAQHQRQEFEALEVLDGLPDELRELCGEQPKAAPQLQPLHEQPADI